LQTPKPDWFVTFFDGLATEMWSTYGTPEITSAQADEIEAALRPQPGALLLDVPCGNGRHACELTRRGYRLTAVDLSANFLAEARATGADVEWVHADMRDLPWRERFDGAYCHGNSFGYFDSAECGRFLKAVGSTLKPGARFLLQSGAVAEAMLPTLTLQREMQIGPILMSSRARYVLEDSRLDIEYTFRRDGLVEVKPISQWIHTIGEIRRMASAGGLALESLGGFAIGQYGVSFTFVRC
jgi:SAM-dependent methyltransferase